MMDLQELRSDFRAFVGAERYSKFLRSLNLNACAEGRLLYWQEKLWNAFVSSSGLQSIDVVDLGAIFGICELHDCPLVPVEHESLPEIRITDEYLTAENNTFPCCGAGGWMCPDCRAAHRRWIDENAELCSPLRCRTTYLEYCERWLFCPDEKIPESLMRRIENRDYAIAAVMQPGDELWEIYDFNDSAGGLAVVRDGRIIRKWYELK